MAVSQIIVLRDSEMPEGHDWLRLDFDDGRRVIYLAESSELARECGLESGDRLTLSA